MTDQATDRDTDTTEDPQSHGPVVVGIDFSKPNLPAVDYAATEAQRHGWPLVLTHAVDPHGAPATYLALPWPELMAQAEGELADWATVLRREHPGLVVRTSVVGAAPAAALVEASERAGMVVIGSRGHGSLDQLLLGSVAWRVISRARGAVVLVRPDPRLAEEASGPVLVGVDDSESGAAAVDFAFAEARARGCDLVAVTVWALPRPDGLAIGRTWPAEADDWQREMADDARRMQSEAMAGKAGDYADVRVTHIVTHGLNVALTLLEVAATERADLVVVGGRNANPLSELVLGAVGVQLSHHADRPIAVVHG